MSVREGCHIPITKWRRCIGRRDPRRVLQSPYTRSMTRGCLYEVGPDNQVRQYLIQQDQILIGRGADCDIQLTDHTVSRHHALLTMSGGCHVRDLGGANVTRVNGVAIGRDATAIKQGDIIGIGGCSLRFAAEPVEAVTASVDAARTVELNTAVLTGTLSKLV